MRVCLQVGWRIAAGAYLLLLLGGCVVVPPHDGLARIRVDDVVKRVKCDIAIAVLNKTNVREREVFVLGHSLRRAHHMA